MKVLVIEVNPKKFQVEGQKKKSKLGRYNLTKFYEKGEKN